MTFTNRQYDCNRPAQTCNKLCYEIQCCSKSVPKPFHNKGCAQSWTMSPWSIYQSIDLDAEWFYSPFAAGVLTVCSSAFAFCIFRVAHCGVTHVYAQCLCDYLHALKQRLTVTSKVLIRMVMYVSEMPNENPNMAGIMMRLMMRKSQIFIAQRAPAQKSSIFTVIVPETRWAAARPPVAQM